MLTLVFSLVAVVHAETVSIVIASNAALRVQFGAEKLVEALKAVKVDVVIARSENVPGRMILLSQARNSALGREGFSLIRSSRREEAQTEIGNRQSAIGNQLETPYVVSYEDASGALYGCLELASRIRAAGRLPDDLQFKDKPAMTLRGNCVGMQKTYILPGRKVYEYPYTPELFPWFYDKALWREYLDSLVANRMNTLYLWNGHPFASLVKLKDYPEAVEVSPEVFAQNVEMFHWLTTECDRRGIWLVQMFWFMREVCSWRKNRLLIGHL